MNEVTKFHKEGTEVEECFLPTPSPPGRYLVGLTSVCQKRKNPHSGTGFANFLYKVTPADMIKSTTFVSKNSTFVTFSGDFGLRR